MEPPAVRVHLCPDPEADRNFHLLLDVLAGAIAEDIFERARREVAGRSAPPRLDVSTLRTVMPQAPTSCDLVSRARPSA